MTKSTDYPSLEAFYDADPQARTSPEADYGVWWMSGGSWPKYRVSYVRSTGEVYAVQLSGIDRVEVLGVVPPDQGRTYYATLDRILEGWALHCGFDLDGISWVKKRLALHGMAAPGGDEEAGQKGGRKWQSAH